MTGLGQRALARCRDVLRGQRRRLQRMLGGRAATAPSVGPGRLRGSRRRGAPATGPPPDPAQDPHRPGASGRSADVADLPITTDVLAGGDPAAGVVALQRDRRTPAWVALALGVALIAWSMVANWAIGDAGYTARNLLLTAGALVGAHYAGLERAELGLTRGDVGSGLRWGGGALAAIAITIGAGIALADVLPGVTSLLADERAELGGRALTTAMLVRIPFGTALFEEVVFRGVLLGVLLRSTTPTTAAFASSVVFGLWHIAPTAVGLGLNGIAATSPAGLAAIAGAVAVTTVAGLAFSWLRLRSGSLLAPVLAHWATNALGLLAAATR